MDQGLWCRCGQRVLHERVRSHTSNTLAPLDKRAALAPEHEVIRRGGSDGSPTWAEDTCTVVDPLRVVDARTDADTERLVVAEHVDTDTGGQSTSPVATRRAVTKVPPGSTLHVIPTPVKVPVQRRLYSPEDLVSDVGTDVGYYASHVKPTRTRTSLPTQPPCGPTRITGAIV